MTARGSVLMGVIALLALQLLWHGVLLPPRDTPPWIYAASLCLPLLPAILLAFRGNRAAAFAGALAALLYFCHGVMEAMSVPAERDLAIAEILLSLWVILAYSWPGLRRRLLKKTSPPE